MPVDILTYGLPSRVRTSGLQTLKVGDLVQFDVIEAVAVGLKPKA